MVYTYAVLEVSQACFDEIAGLMREAGYDHVFHQDDQHGSLIDMHGIALAMRAAGSTALPKPPEYERVERCPFVTNGFRCLLEVGHAGIHRLAHEQQFDPTDSKS
jgi:hypothetical protein